MEPTGAENIMKRHLKAITLILLASTFMIACRDTAVLHSTPEEAFENINEIQSGTYKNKGIIEITQFDIEGQNLKTQHSHIFFILGKESNGVEKDTLGVAELENKGEGWSLVEIYTAGVLEAENIGSSIRATGVKGQKEDVGMVPNHVATAKLGEKEAMLIPVKDYGVKIAVFFNPTEEELKESILFFDENGELLN